MNKANNKSIHFKDEKKNLNTWDSNSNNYSEFYTKEGNQQHNFVRKSKINKEKSSHNKWNLPMFNLKHHITSLSPIRSEDILDQNSHFDTSFNHNYNNKMKKRKQIKHNFSNNFETMFTQMELEEIGNRIWKEAHS